MAEFLSAEWFRELDAAARGSRALTEVGRDMSLVVEQRVVGSPRGDVVYHLALGADGGRLVEGAAPNPDITLTTDFATAVDLHRGATNAQQALVRGRLKIGGDVTALVRFSDVIRGFDDVFASVRAATTGVDHGAASRR